VTRDKLEDLIAGYQPALPPTRNAAGGTCFTLDQILRGLEEKQFEHFFQPKVKMATGQTIGAEALVRWRHPKHGLVGPNAFISLLEQSGKIDELTFPMLEESVNACRAWRAGGLELTVSVNLSLVSLADTTLADRLMEAVSSSGLDGDQVIFEVMETVAMTKWRSPGESCSPTYAGFRAFG
jgi:EAL domain-containing protein (putative c-di-GMP-specific phosphodiesterase class I)